ncbi:hypothetical protein ACH9L7_11270 [Haloferax sp. S1W]|uniref:hypothetical protein n=1 Tax=Haloferax sp. S1W TaxID=3377110 RepID=UPI0037C84B0F
MAKRRYTTKRIGGMNWEVHLKGNEADLNILTEVFESDPLVTKEGDRYILKTSKLEGVEDSEPAFEIAENTLEIMSGVMKLNQDAFEPVSIVSLISSDGQKVVSHLTVLRHRGSAEFREQMGLPSWEEDAVFDTNRLITLADSDKSVHEFLKRWARGDTWENMYKILEHIEEDMSGERIHDLGWIKKVNYDDFKGTANSYSVIGLEARHGSYKDGPNQPMSKPDAKALIQTVCSEWLSKKWEQHNQK